MAKCARAECGKTVYPMEELKCLDQVNIYEFFTYHEYKRNFLSDLAQAMFSLSRLQYGSKFEKLQRIQ